MLVTGFHHIFSHFSERLKSDHFGKTTAIQNYQLADTVFRELYSQSFHNLVNVNMQKGKLKKEILFPTIMGERKVKYKTNKTNFIVKATQKYLNNICWKQN